LAGKFRTLDALAAGNVADFSAVLGAERATGLVVYFKETGQRAVIMELLALGVRPLAPAGATGALAGKIFVLTGTLPTLSRAQATEKIEAAGGKVSGSVSARTDYVVAGTEPGVKREQARTLKVPVIDEAELLRMIAGK